MQLGIENPALVVRRHGVLLDQVEHLAGGMVGQIGEVRVLQRQLEQRTFQPFHQQFHVRTGNEVRPRPSEQVRSGIQNLPMTRRKASCFPREGDARIDLIGQ